MHGFEACKETVLLLSKPLSGKCRQDAVSVWFLTWEFPNCTADLNCGGWGVAGDQQDFLKTDFVVKYKGLFVSLNLGNSTFEMWISEWLC